MNIAPLSFGRIVKVNAPVEISDKIADIANKKGAHPLAKMTRSIFYDRSQGEVVALNPTENRSVSYLFSGEDAQKAMDIEKETIGECEKMCGYYFAEDDMVNTEYASSCKKAAEKLNSLIASQRHISMMNVIPTNDGSDIKFIDLNA